MHGTRSFASVLFLVGSLIGAAPASAAENTSPPSVTSHEVDVLRQVANALTAGTDAIQEFRGAPIEHFNMDRLKLPTPGMECGIGRSVIYVACHSASLNKKEAEALFAKIMDDALTALPSDSWKAVDGAPYGDSVRLKSYYHLKSNAQIDVDLVSQPGSGEQPLYWLRVYGWKRF